MVTNKIRLGRLKEIHKYNRKEASGLDFIGSEIRSFFSIREICSVLDEEISNSKSVSEEYSQWLWTFLRDSEGSKENAEWTKKKATLQKGKPQRE